MFFLASMDLENIITLVLSGLSLILHLEHHMANFRRSYCKCFAAIYMFRQKAHCAVLPSHDLVYKFLIMVDRGQWRPIDPSKATCLSIMLLLACPQIKFSYLNSLRRFLGKDVSCFILQTISLETNFNQSWGKIKNFPKLKGQRDYPTLHYANKVAKTNADKGQLCRICQEAFWHRMIRMTLMKSPN